MNILIPHSWLKDYLETNATPKQFAQAMSLTSVSIERMEKVGDDVVYDIEVTTNRPDLMSVIGLAREASAVLPQQGFKATFKPGRVDYNENVVSSSKLVNIKIDPELVNRILAVVMEIDLGESPDFIKDRLTKTGIRTINNAVDVTNYIMRDLGHPSHVFDYDRLPNHTLIIRKSKKGEKIITLDEKEYILPGDDIVADDGAGNIVDLLGIMGTANSVVTPETKRILLFLDNNNPNLLRKTSMNLGIRTEAAILNEKGVNPDIMLPTLLKGIELLKKFAKAKSISPIIDLYPNKVKPKTVKITKDKIDKSIGLEIPQQTVVEILKSLGFSVNVKNNEFEIEIFTSRINDIDIPEDIVEEVARVYGYHKIPNQLPPSETSSYYHQDENEFYWLGKIKEAFRFWGYNEVYTYSMVGEELFDGPIENAIKLKNPLTEDKTYLRNSLVPSIIDVVSKNKNENKLLLFEIANVYINKKSGLPDEILHLGVVIKDENSTFFNGKGVVEQLANILSIKNLSFEKKTEGLDGCTIEIGSKKVGSIEVDEYVTIELDLQEVLKHANAKKKYKQPAKFPPIIEDVRVEMAPHYHFSKIEKAIKEVSDLVHDVSILDVYKNKKTFRITYLDRSKSLTTEDIAPIRAKIENVFTSQFKATLG